MTQKFDRQEWFRLIQRIGDIHGGLPLDTKEWEAQIENLAQEMGPDEQREFERFSIIVWAESLLHWRLHEEHGLAGPPYKMPENPSEKLSRHIRALIMINELYNRVDSGDAIGAASLAFVLGGIGVIGGDVLPTMTREGKRRDGLARQLRVRERRDAVGLIVSNHPDLDRPALVRKVHELTGMPESTARRYVDYATAKSKSGGNV